MRLSLSRPPLAEQAAEILRTALRDGVWIDRLPGERELSRRLNISRPTLRAALDRLTQDGWLENSQGRARTIVRRPPAPPSPPRQVIGLLTPLPLPEVPPFALCWMDKLRELLAGEGWQLEIHSGRRWYSRRPEKDLAALTQQAPAAAWILFSTNERMQRWFAENQLAGVLSGTCHEGVELPAVDFDYRAVCRHAVGEFLARGHQRIVLLLQDTGAAGDRESEAGFLEGFQNRAAAEVMSQVVRHDGTPQHIRQRLEGLLRQRAVPTAFLVGRSMPALTVASELLRRGIRLPQDAAVIARDSDHFFDYFSPSLARYRANPESHARSLFRIVRQLTGGTTSHPRSAALMPEFYAGESLGERRAPTAE